MQVVAPPRDLAIRAQGQTGLEKALLALPGGTITLARFEPFLFTDSVVHGFSVSPGLAAGLVVVAVVPFGIGVFVAFRERAGARRRSPPLGRGGRACCRCWRRGARPCAR